MMIDSEYDIFSSMWRAVHAVMPGGKTFTDAAMSFVFDVLCDYPLDIIEQALKIHGRTGKFAPSPNDIVEIIDAGLGIKRLSADEAWALMPLDEYGGKSPFTVEKTVVWTEEMAEAFRLASKLLEEGDKIGARMTFKSAYDRLCQQAALQQKPVHWKIVPGYDKEEVKSTLQAYVSAGRISQDQANKCLMHPDLYQEVSAGRISQDEAMKMLPSPDNSGLIAGMVSGKITELPKDAGHFKAHWSELKAAMKLGVKNAEQARIQAAEDLRNDFESRRQEQLAKVEARLGEALA